MYFTKQQKQEKRSIVFAFTVGFIMAAMALFISCGAEQPVIDEQALFIEQAQLKDEYYLLVPGEGIRYQSPDMKEPISIKFGDSFLQIEEMYKNSDSEVTANTLWYYQEIEIIDSYVGELSIYFNDYRVDTFYVKKGSWILPSGISIAESIRWDITDHYGEPDHQVSGYTCSYDQDNISFTFSAEKYLGSYYSPPPDTNDPIVMISIQPIE